MVLQYKLPSLERAYAKPLLTTDHVDLFKFRWSEKPWWVVNDPRSQWYKRAATAKKPHQQEHVAAMARLLGGRGGRVIDVGANIGLMSVAYSRFCDNVVGFEPAPRSMELAAKNVVIQGVSDKVALFEVGLADRARTPYLYEAAYESGVNYVLPKEPNLQRKLKGSRYVKIEVAALDSFNFTDVTALKVDVEGSEYHVLQGAEDTIRRCRPVVQVEIMETTLLRRYKLAPQVVYDWFLARDYEVQDINGKNLGTKWVYAKREADKFFVPK